MTLDANQTPQAIEQCDPLIRVNFDSVECRRSAQHVTLQGNCDRLFRVFGVNVLSPRSGWIASRPAALVEIASVLACHFPAFHGDKFSTALVEVCN